jgi:16S rRNA (adenine1518-N6/adenine1519-N6)-dimethyltransferase
MSGERDSFGHYLARMEALGFRPSSVLGQNFLLDPTLHRWLAERAAPTAASTVLEIGVGLGFLTRELAARAGRVVAVEIDDRLLQIAQQELADCRNVQWVAGDALGGPGGSLLPAIPLALAAARAGEGSGGDLLVVANLPYSVSGPLLAELMALDPLPARAVLLVQKEMAQRVAAPCGHDDYGGLSALVQAAFTARSLRDVSPQVFRPRPKVTSSVLLLERRAGGGVTDSDGDGRREFARFVRQLFQQRRKVLRTTLPRAAEAIGALPPELSAELLAGRAEQVDPDTLVAWWRGCRRGAGSA